MDLKILYSIVFTILPLSELRIGLPLALIYALENKVDVGLIFAMILLINLILVFFIFFFLDYLHLFFMKINIYNRLFNWYSNKFQKKLNKFNKKYNNIGFFALILFVAIPLPGTGAWTGSLLSWMLKLDRRKSILAIWAGVIIAGLLIFLGFLGIFYVL